ncbi:MAG: bifunctional enoyl-CoA hydratase/phosphate acetyltransferase [Proteobacteria bacterium]|nr:bifunctional enoyl-CoA hydratase/phosphate acetyltransferase [Pseudomonadota bacterium]
MPAIENRTWDELHVGDAASLERTLTQQDIALFAAVSGDINPAHVDEDYARSDRFGHVIAHGMWGGALISAVLGTRLPGPGTIYLEQSLRFLRPVAVGDTVKASVRVAARDDHKHRVSLDCAVVNQRGEQVIVGTALVLAPSEKISREAVAMPSVALYWKGHRHEALIARAKGLPPLRTAIVHPVDERSLQGALAAAQAGLIAPVLVGPEARIRDAATRAGMDLGRCDLIGTEHSHAAAATAVALARDGKVEALMKGALHTDELMQAVVAADGGLRTGRRISHVFAIDAPAYPRMLFVTDAAINIQPDLPAKADIAQNAIDLVRALGVASPRLAILAAVETINADLRSTLDAAALCKMAERGQIVGGVLDGPLAFDNAVSEQAAQAKGIASAVAGRADIVLAPDLEAGNILAKQLEYLADAQTAGIVLGARVPIVLTSRADGVPARLASCAIAQLWARRPSTAQA